MKPARVQADPPLDLATLVSIREQLQDLRKRAKTSDNVVAALEGMLSLAIAVQRGPESRPPLRVLRSES